MLNRSTLVVLTVLTLMGGGSYVVLSKPAPATPEHSPESHDTHEHADKDNEEVGIAAAHADAEHGVHEDHDEHAAASSDGEVVKIDPGAARTLQIDVIEATRGSIRQTTDVNGRIALDQTATAQVKARFPGVIRSVVRQPGDIVQAGEILATVESNDSLQVYPVKAPVAGTVITRTANVGELAGDSALFVVADLSKLWVELFVFARDGDKIRTGQPVRVHRIDNTVEADAVLTLILPTADAASQTIVARAALPNPAGVWRAGMTVRAAIAHAETPVTVAVRSQAIQRLDNKTIVFVQTADDTYRAQPVEIGVSDDIWTEVRSGLTAGQRYVASNSFILKAELGKSGAEHDH